MKTFYVKALAGFLSFTIIAMIVMAGPAESFVLGLTISDSVIDQGESVEFGVEAEVENADMYMNIQEFRLDLAGPIPYSCRFNPDGVLLSPCPGVSIQKIQSPAYQYGYGFFPGVLKFKVTLDTGYLVPDTYQVTLATVLPDEEILTEQKEINIVQGNEEIFSCSLRADEGNAKFEGASLNTKNKASLYTGGEKSAMSEGSITSTKGQTRIIYDFRVTRAIPVGSDKVVFYTTGDISEGRERNTQSENARIIYNAATSTIDVVGDDYQVTGMDVKFARC